MLDQVSLVDQGDCHHHLKLFPKYHHPLHPSAPFCHQSYPPATVVTSPHNYSSQCASCKHQPMWQDQVISYELTSKCQAQITIMMMLSAGHLKHSVSLYLTEKPNCNNTIQCTFHYWSESKVSDTVPQSRISCTSKVCIRVVSTQCSLMLGIPSVYNGTTSWVYNDKPSSLQC